MDDARREQAIELLAAGYSRRYVARTIRCDRAAVTEVATEASAEIVERAREYAQDHIAAAAAIERENITRLQEIRDSPANPKTGVFAGAHTKACELLQKIVEAKRKRAEATGADASADDTIQFSTIGVDEPTDDA